VLPTGQSCSLQEVVLVSSPRQSAPPFEGGGLLQSLVLVLFPPPQVTVQLEKAPQFPHCPSEKQYSTVYFLLLHLVN
jgi:hypothetical protein